VREAKSRDGANTMLLKEFDGGFSKTIGSAKQRRVTHGLTRLQSSLLDEADGYPLDADGEGSRRVQIAEHRTETFDDAKTF
jgi:phage terminase large subunit GpA-like protein